MKRLLFTGFLILNIGLSAETGAQQTLAAALRDSIDIEALFALIEDNSPCRIYSDIEPSFKVFVEAKDVPPETGKDSTVRHPETTDQSSPYQEVWGGLIRQALAGTPYHVSVYENSIFVLKGKSLETALSSALFHTQNQADTIHGDMTQAVKTESSTLATSENLVYMIGDPRNKDIPVEVTLRGKIVDARSGSGLPGVNLVLAAPYAGATTDEQGNYTIRLPSGRVRLDISGMNIQASRRQLMLYDHGTLNIEIYDETYLLDEVIVTARRADQVKSIQLGAETVQIPKVKNIPMVFGEVDILKVVQSLPGVKTVGEASTGYNVRGGATDQNLILLNNGTSYNPNHLFGFFTAFNSDMLKEAELFKSSIPAQYGGRISSVLDITSKEADKKAFKGSAGLGVVTSRLMLEIPVIEDRTSVLLCGRTTYSDWILRQLPEKSGFNNGWQAFTTSVPSSATR